MKQNRKLLHKVRFTAFVASSVDGRISLSTHTRPDWTSREDWQFLQESLGSYDAVVVGRNTFRAAEKRLRKRNTYVFSRTVAKTKQEGLVTFVNPARVNLATLLSTHKRIAVLGGSSVYQFMLSKKMLNELYITIEPLVFGRGIPMFSGGSKNHTLALRSVRRLNKKGTLLLRYEIQP